MLLLFFFSANIAEKVFDAAVRLKMLKKNWAWLVTEQALKAKNVPPGKTISNSSKRPKTVSAEGIFQALHVLRLSNIHFLICVCYPSLQRGVRVCDE